jgi:hypothetical protein
MKPLKRPHSLVLPGLRTASLAGLACLAIAASPLAARARSEEPEPPLVPGDFAHGRSIETKQPGALQTLLIPVAVYRGSVEPRLADLRVFDAAGEAVPHTIRSLDTPEPLEELSEPLPLFAIPEGATHAPALGAEPGAEPGAKGFWKRKELLRVDATIIVQEAHIRVESGAAAGAPASRTTGYLVDRGEPTRDLPVQDKELRKVVGLELEFAPSEAPFVAALRVRGSDDLVRFEKLAPRATIARLEQGGHRIELTRIDFPASRHRYLEITWPGGDRPVELAAVRARLAPRAPAQHRFHAKLKGRAAQDEPRIFLFDLGGTPPVDRMQVELPRSNDAVEARLLSGTSPEGPWYPLYSGLVFDVEHAGTRHRNEAIAARKARHRHYRLEVSPKGGGSGGRAPVLDVAWRPEQLIFVARGEAPFSLSYGRAEVAASNFDFSDLLAIAREFDRELPLESAALGRERAVADPSVLEAPGRTMEPRTVALWFALILAVALIAGMSLRVLRQMKR